MAVLHNRLTDKSGRTTERRYRIGLCMVFAALSFVNIGLLASQPTVWQSVFAAVLLAAALWLWFDGS